jgi:WD40 repeat protein
MRVLDRDSLEVKRIPIGVATWRGSGPAFPIQDYCASHADECTGWRVTGRFIDGASLSPALAVSIDHMAMVQQRLGSLVERAGRLQLWRTQSFSTPQGWHDPAAAGVLRFSADGRLLVAATQDRRIKVWNTGTLAPVGELSEPDSEIASLTFSLDGRRLAAVAKDGVVHIWDIRSGRKVLRLSSSAKLASLDRDGSHVAITRNSPRGSLQIFEADSAHLQLSTDQSDPPSSYADKMPFSASLLQALPIPIGDVTFSPDGKRIAVAGDESVLLKDTETGSIVSKLEGTHANRITFTPDGSRLVTLDRDGDISFWNPSRGDQLLTLHCSELGSTGLIVRSFDIGMERLVCVANDGTVHTWDAQSRNYPGARDLATFLLRQHFLVSEAVQYLEKDAGVDEPLRKAAIEELQARADDLTGLADWAGKVVTAAVPSRGDYQLALRRLQTAAAIPAPEAPLALRLGEVQYRIGRYEDARKSLSTVTCTSCYERLLFLAMTYQRLGSSAEAREQLNNFRVQVRSVPFFSFSNPPAQLPTPGSVLARLIQEAESLIGGSR